MAYKMKGAPMIDTSSKHGTNANYKKSGPPFNILDPLGLAKKAKNFLGGNKNCPPQQAAAAQIGAAKPAEPVTPTAPAAAAPTAPTPEEAPPTMMKKGLKNGAPMKRKIDGKRVKKEKITKLKPGDNGSGTYKPSKKKKAMDFKKISEETKKVGAPKLVGKQKNIDKNKNGKIDAGDFKAMKNGPTKKSKY